MIYTKQNDAEGNPVPVAEALREAAMRVAERRRIENNARPVNYAVTGMDGWGHQIRYYYVDTDKLGDPRKIHRAVWYDLPGRNSWLRRTSA